jgi:hypothetical protein
MEVIACEGNLKIERRSGIGGGKVEIEYPQFRKKREIPFGLFKTADVTIIVSYTEVI